MENKEPEVDDEINGQKLNTTKSITNRNRKEERKKERKKEREKERKKERNKKRKEQLIDR